MSGRERNLQRIATRVGKLEAAPLWLLLLLTLGGCGQGLTTEYGKSKGRSGAQSLNGFGTLRQSFERNAWQTRDIRRLNERLQPLDVVVWTPTAQVADESDAVFWFQQWLDERPRTLIFVLPDEGSELDYWRLARDLAPPGQRLEYRRRYARTLARWMTRITDQQPVINRTWFKAKRRPAGLPGWEILKHEETAESSAGAPRAVSVSKVAPVTGRGWDDTGSWPTPEELADIGPLRYEPLVEAADGTTRLMRITWQSAAKPRRAAVSAGESQILVVAGGSQVSNFALAQSAGRDLARTLLAQCERTVASKEKRVGFLLSGAGGVPVRDPSEPPISAGMELLTVWPLSLVTMHLALMGIVACLILLPIFGRPRRLKVRSSSDFADHIQAVAVLMHRAGGETFARLRISEYFRRVRGETTGKWVLPESPGPAAPLHLSSQPHQPVSGQDDTLASIHPTDRPPKKDEPPIESANHPHHG